MPTYADHLETLREELAYGLDLAFEEDDARMYALLYRTAREVARKGEPFDPAVTLTLAANTARYDFAGSAFGKPVGKVLRLTRDGAGLPLPSPYGAYSPRTTASGTVGDSYVGPDFLFLSPAPSGTEAARAWTVRALLSAAAPLMDGTNATGLPDDLDAVVPILAMRQANRRSMQPEQFARLKAAQDEAYRAISEYRSESRRARYTLAEYRARWIQR